MIIVVVLFAFLVMLLMAYCIFNKIKREENIVVKTIVVILLIILFIPLIVFYGDFFNILTRFGWNINDNTKEWIGNYLTELLSTIIGTIVTVYITIHEIRENNKNERINNNEYLRIENMPLLKLNLLRNEVTNSFSQTELDTIANDKSGVIQSIFLEMKNIGLNTARNISVTINSDIFEKEYAFKINNQMLLEKNEATVKELIIKLKTDCNYKFTINIYYQDLLQNNYKQECILDYYLTSTFTNNEYQFRYEFNRENEKIIEEYPKLKIE